MALSPLNPSITKASVIIQKVLQNLFERTSIFYQTYLSQRLFNFQLEIDDLQDLKLLELIILSCLIIHYSFPYIRHNYKENLPHYYHLLHCNLKLVFRESSILTFCMMSFQQMVYHSQLQNQDLLNFTYPLSSLHHQDYQVGFIKESLMMPEYLKYNNYLLFLHQSPQSANETMLQNHYYYCFIFLSCFLKPRQETLPYFHPHLLLNSDQQKEQSAII